MVIDRTTISILHYIILYSMLLIIIFLFNDNTSELGKFFEANARGDLEPIGDDEDNAALRNWFLHLDPMRN